MDDRVVLLPPHEQLVSAIDVARCQFDYDGHDWLDITTLKDIERRFVCCICGALGKESR